MTEFGAVESLGALASNGYIYDRRFKSWLEIPIMPDQVQTSVTDTDSADGSFNSMAFSVHGFYSGQTLLMAVLTTREDSTNPASPTIIDSAITWVSVADLLFDSTGTQRGRLTVFRAQANADGYFDPLTIDYGGVNQDTCNAHLIALMGEERSGTNGSAAVVQSATGTASGGADVSATLAAFGHANNATLAFVGATREAGSIAHNFDVAEWHDERYSSGSDTYFSRIISSWKFGNDTSPTKVMGSHDEAGMIALEIKRDTVDPEPNVGARARPAFVGKSDSTGTYQCNLHDVEYRFQT